jgi:glycosyltransferase involved in cell wall biosynthesis
MKISVITPCLNAAEHLEVAIQSVQGQSYRYFEHIIVDGGSTDGTVDILRRHPEIVWESEPDEGQSNAMNKGFGMATGDVIVYLNADDYFLLDAFDTVVRKFSEGYDFVVGDVLVKMDEGYFLNTPRIEFGEMLRHWEPNAFPNNPVGYFYKRKVQDAIGFNEDNHLIMDLEFLLSARLQFDFHKIDNVLGVYRAFGDTKTLRAQLEPDYWQESNFSVLDKFLIELSDEERNRFNSMRRAGFDSKKIEISARIDA